MQAKVLIQRSAALLNAGKYSRLSGAEKAVVQWAQLDDHQAVLTLSPGSDRLFQYFQQRYRHIRMCAMVNDPMLARIARQSNAEAEILYASLFDFPWQSSAFDLVVVPHCLLDSRDALKTLDEAKRVMKAGAQLMISLPAGPFRFPGFDVQETRAPTRLVSRRCLLKVLERLGFADVSWRYAGLVYGVAIAYKRD